MSSVDLKGGVDNALTRRTYPNNDSVVYLVSGAALVNGIPFTATQTYYISGVMAYLNNSAVVNAVQGWTLYTHGEQAAPTYLTTLLTLAGVSWPTAVPAFEAKRTALWATEDCFIRFNGPTNVPQFLRAETPYEYDQEWFSIYVVQEDTNGTLHIKIEG